MNTAGWIIAALTLLWLTGNLFTAVLQRWFIMRPARSSENTAYSFEDLFRELWFHPEPGVKLHALWFQSKTRPPKGVLLYFHGNAGNLERWGEIGPRFTRLGYDILIPDYRGFGKSQGPISEEGYNSDAEHLLLWMQDNYPGIPHYIYGRSMGSGVACHLASRSAVNGLILETPFSGMKRLFYHYYPFLPRVFFFRFRFPNLENLARFEHPVLIFAGTRDWIVPYRCAKELKAALKPGDRFISIAGAGHAQISGYEEYKNNLDIFLRETQSKAPAGSNHDEGPNQREG